MGTHDSRNTSLATARSPLAAARLRVDSLIHTPRDLSASDFRELQEGLRVLGFDLPVSGKPDGQTGRAIEQYLSAYNVHTPVGSSARLAMACAEAAAIASPIQQVTAKAPPPERPSPPSRDPIIVLDPGHGHYTLAEVRTKRGTHLEKILDGGNEVRTGGRTIVEADVVLAVAKEARSILQDRYGYKQVHLTRENGPIDEVGDTRKRGNKQAFNRATNFAPRIEVADSQRADVFLSIHADDDGGRGTSRGSKILQHDDASAASVRFARIMHTSLGSAKEILKGDWGVLEGKTPSALAEIGFLSNSRDRRDMLSSEGRHRIAGRIAEGIDAFVKSSRSLTHHGIQLAADSPPEAPVNRPTVQHQPPTAVRAPR